MTALTLNQELNGIEIKFDCKPVSEVLNTLKSNGFRWHGKKKVWYAKQTPERLELAKTISESVDYTEKIRKEEPKKAGASGSACRTEKTKPLPSSSPHLLQNRCTSKAYCRQRRQADSRKDIETGGDRHFQALHQDIAGIKGRQLRKHPGKKYQGKESPGHKMQDGDHAKQKYDSAKEPSRRLVKKYRHAGCRQAHKRQEADAGGFPGNVPRRFGSGSQHKGRHSKQGGQAQDSCCRHGPRPDSRNHRKAEYSCRRSGLCSVSPVRTIRYTSFTVSSGSWVCTARRGSEPVISTFSSS